jgi:hypothetical protein
MGVDVLSIGLDPGMTTGLAIMKGNTSQKYSEGVWAVHVDQIHVDLLAAEGRHTFDGGDAEGAHVTIGWWDRMSAAGIGLAMKVYEIGVAESVVSGGPDRVIYVTMEDFILRPAAGGSGSGGRGGAGGRDIVSPVAIGAAFWGQLRQMCDWKMQFSAPSQKALMENEKLDRWFGDGKSGWRSGKPHGTDALRHAVMGIRMGRAKGN